MPIDLERYSKNGYEILKFKEILVHSTDISGLKGYVDGILNEGKKRIAIHLTENSYLSSISVSILAQCGRKVAENSGKFVFVISDKEIRNFFEIFGIDNLIEIYDSEDDLAE